MVWYSNLLKNVPQFVVIHTVKDFGKVNKTVDAFLVLSCMSCLYILEINFLSVVSFATIFSYSEGCLFTLLIPDMPLEKPVCRSGSNS